MVQPHVPTFTLQGLPLLQITLSWGGANSCPAQAAWSSAEGLPSFLDGSNRLHELCAVVTQACHTPIHWQDTKGANRTKERDGKGRWCH